MDLEDVEAHLINVFPDFSIDECALGLPYCVAGNFALYLLNAYTNNSIDTLLLAGKFIETLYTYNDDKIEELATIGYLEAIQNVWANNDVDPEIIFNHLGITSQKWWVELNKFWNGEEYSDLTSP